MSYSYPRYGGLEINRLPSGLFFRVDQAEQHIQPPLIRSRDIGQSGIAHDELNHNDFVVPEYRSTKDDKELYLPLLEVSVEVEAVATIAWTKLTQTFTNRATHPITEATYCFPLYDNSTVTAFNCTIGSGKVLKGVVKPKSQAKAEFKEAVARQRVAALLEEHTPEVFETSVGKIPAQTTVKIEICYITELKADLSGDGILVTIPTSVAPRYGAPPSSIPSMNSSKSLAVPPENGLQIRIQVLSPVAISKIECRTHPVSVEMGSHGHTTTRNIRDLAKNQESPSFDPKKARATLSDRSTCLGKDFVLLVQSRDGQLLASRALLEPHPKIQNHSALMVSMNLRDIYIPNAVSPEPSEIIFLADRSGSMRDKMEALKTAMRFFLRSLPNNCSFNICSFGSSYALMWPESRPYNQENVEAALSYTSIHFAADMGGTELLSGLRHIVQKSSSSINTEIITLTDGEVWDSNNIFEFIRETRSSGPKDKTRFFCLGIGEAVSHHLVSGIARHGGGLAEVVPVDSAGDWMGRVIGMLGAALTPSSWKVEIVLDDLSISNQKREAGSCIQAPYHIPEFHAFSRSSVYFLLSQELSTKVVKVKATAVATGESVTAELPIERLESRRTCVHPLAAKAILGDLETGRSWLHDTSSNGNNANINTGVEDVARTEGENIGVEWGISSKWTSFIVVDNSSSVEKPSRWYRAEKSDLAELTRPRLGTWNQVVQINSAAAPPGTSAPVPPSAPLHPSALSLSHNQLTADVSCFNEAQIEKSTSHARQAYYGGAYRRSELSGQDPGYPRFVTTENGGQKMAFKGDRVESTQRTRLTCSTGSCDLSIRSRPASMERSIPQEPEIMGTFLESCNSVDSTESNESTESVGVSSSYAQGPSLLASKSSRDHREDAANKPAVYNRERYARTSSSPGKLILSECLSADSSSSQRASKHKQNLLHPLGSRIPWPYLPLPPPLIQELTLEILLDSNTVTGAFILSPDLRKTLTAKFRPMLKNSIDHWSRIVLKEGVKFNDVNEVIDTAMSIVYIENAFNSDKSLWSLVVQKARALLEGLVPLEKQRRSLFEILRSCLGEGLEDFNMKPIRFDEMAGNFSMANLEKETGNVSPSNEAPGQRSIDSQGKEIVVEQNERDLWDDANKAEEREAGDHDGRDGVTKWSTPRKGVKDVAGEGKAKAKSTSEEPHQSMDEQATDISISVEQGLSRSRSVMESVVNFFSFGKK